MKNSNILSSNHSNPQEFKSISKEQFFSVKKNTKRLKTSNIYSEFSEDRPIASDSPQKTSQQDHLKPFSFFKPEQQQLCSTIGTNSTLSFKRKQPKRKINNKIKNQSIISQTVIDQGQNVILDNENHRNNINKQKGQKSICQLILSTKLKEKKAVAKSWSKEDFIFVHKIGEGTYSEVYTAIQKDSGFVVSLKILNRDKVKALRFQENLLNEIKIHFFLNHPNIAKLYGYFYDELFIYLICEYAVDLTLHDCLNRHKQMGRTVDFQEASIISGQICQAIAYMHQNNIIHRDIKPENILMTFKNTVKLCDFGWSVYNPDKTLRSTLCGTPFYLAPELILQESYDQSVDIWAIGILSYELLTNSSPFRIKNLRQLKNVVNTQVSYAKIKQAQAIDFIGNCLKKNKEERFSIHQLMQHSFLNHYYDQCQAQ